MFMDTFLHKLHKIVLNFLVKAIVNTSVFNLRHIPTISVHPNALLTECFVCMYV